jgi:hypothetical protein
MPFAFATAHSSFGGKRYESGWLRNCVLIQAELRYRMHEPVASVGDWVEKVVSGF